MFFIPTQMIWQLSYATIFGGGTIFLTGILTSSLPPVKDRKLARIYLTAGVILFCLVAVFIHRMGGYQTGQGRRIHIFFLFMPEILSATVYLVMRGTITEISKVASGDAAIPTLHRAMKSFRSAVFNALAHFGRVSYSAYMFSLFTLDFTRRVFDFIKPSGWLSMISSWILYFLVLTLFSTVSFYAIELPFLHMRRRYLRKKPEWCQADLALCYRGVVRA
jgi:hypothetical protein